MFLKLGRLVAVAVLAGGAAAVVPASAAQAAVGCEATYRTTSWAGGFAATVQLKNLGDTWNGFSFQFAFRGDETVTAAWPHDHVQSGKLVTFRSAEGARPVPTGGTVWLGFLGRHTGTTSPPANLRVNDVYCAVSGQPHVIIEPDVLTFAEGGGTTGFTMRLSQPPPRQLQAQIRTTGGVIFATQPILYYFNELNWNTPQHYLMMLVPSDLNTVDDRGVLTVSVEGYAPDSIVLQEIDRG